jgi:hypothetical protein
MDSMWVDIVDKEWLSFILKFYFVWSVFSFGSTNK